MMPKLCENDAGGLEVYDIYCRMYANQIFEFKEQFNLEWKMLIQRLRKSDVKEDKQCREE